MCISCAIRVGRWQGGLVNGTCIYEAVICFTNIHICSVLCCLTLLSGLPEVLGDKEIIPRCIFIIYSLRFWTVKICNSCIIQALDGQPPLYTKRPCVRFLQVLLSIVITCFSSESLRCLCHVTVYICGVCKVTYFTIWTMWSQESYQYFVVYREW